MNEKESAQPASNTQEIFWKMESVNRPDMYLIGNAARYNIRRNQAAQDQWRRASYTLDRLNWLRRERLKLPLNAVLAEIYDQSYQPINVNPDELRIGSWGKIENLDQLVKLPGINRETKIYRFDPLRKEYVSLKINRNFLPESLSSNQIAQIFISTGFEEQLVNVKRLKQESSNYYYHCFFFDQRDKRWQIFQVDGQPVRAGFFHYDEGGREVLCLLRYRRPGDQWSYYGKPKGLWLADDPYDQKRLKLMTSLLKQIDNSFLQDNRYFEEKIAAILLTADQEDDLTDQIKALIREEIMIQVRNTKNQSRTDQLISIIDRHERSPVVWQTINLDCLMRAVLGEEMNGAYRSGTIASLVDWINDLSRSNVSQLSRIIHDLGDSDGNQKIQALFLKMFVLFSQDNVRTPTDSNIRQEDLFEAGTTMMRILTERPADVGVRFAPFVKAIRQAANKSDYSGDRGRDFATEGEVFYRDKELEWDGAPSDSLEEAFALPDAVLALNLALKKEKLLFGLAGDSLHTHVRFPRMIIDNPEFKRQLEAFFRQLDVNIYLCINPVDRLLGMLKNRWLDLATIDRIPKHKDVRKQSRLGMSLDHLSHAIAKSEARLSRTIGQLIEQQFIKEKSVSQGWQRLINTNRALASHIIKYLNDETEQTDDPTDTVNLTQAINIYQKHLSDLFLDQSQPSFLISYLTERLNRLVADQKGLASKLTKLRKRQEKYGDVPYAVLEETKNQLKRARSLPVDEFFLVGKRRRTEIGTIILRFLDATSEEISEKLR